MTAFDAITAAEQTAAGRFSVTVHDGWGAPVGPNGGYVAALVLQAMLMALGGPERAPRSLTLHYLRAPHPGGAEIEVVEERAGRGLTTLSARMRQGDRLSTIAVGAFAADYPSALEYGPSRPDVPPAADVAPAPPRAGGPTIHDRFDLRPAFGPRPFSGGSEAVTGGWLRLREPRAHDALALAAYVDAWWPSPWGRLPALSPAPTIDLTIHFRARAEAVGLGAEQHVLARYTSRASREGFFEEDAEVWAPDGTLLVQSRQLALLPPPPPP